MWFLASGEIFEDMLQLKRFGLKVLESYFSFYILMEKSILYAKIGVSQFFFFQNSAFYFHICNNDTNTQ